MKYLIMIVAVMALVIILPACSGSAVTTTPTGILQYRPIEVVSVIGPIPPYNPGGPVIEITLKNVGTETVVAIKATLALPGEFTYDFGSLVAGETRSVKKTLITGGVSSGASYPLTITGELESGGNIEYTITVMIQSPPPAE